MKTPPTPQNQDEFAEENMQKRLKNMFSGQELPSYANIREVEAMKARITELEAELAQTSLTMQAEVETQPLHDPRTENISMTLKSTRHRNSAASGIHDRAQTASRILTLLLVTLVLSLPLYIYWAIKLGTWQMYAIVASMVVAGFVAAIAIPLARRNRVDLAIGIVMALAYLVFPIMAALISGLGLILGITQFLLILAVFGQTFSGPSATRALFVGLVFTAFTILVDLFTPWTRLSIPAFNAVLPYFSFALLIGLGILVASQFRNYSVRNKLIIMFVMTALIAIGAVGTVTDRVATAQFDRVLGNNFYELAARMAKETSDTLLRSKIAMDGLVLNKFVQDTVESENLDGTSDASALAKLDQQWIVADSNSVLVRQVLNNSLAAELRKLQTRLPQYAELFVTDQYGAVIASTDRTSDYYQADEEWWQTAWNQGQGNAYISQPTFDESEGIYAIEIALPIPAHNRSKVIGVLRATIDLNELTGVLAANQFGQTGHAILIFPDNQYITREAGKNLQTLSPETARGIFALNSSYGEFAFDEVPSLVSKAAVTLENGQDKNLIDPLGWTIIIHQDLSEAHQPITATTRGIMLSSLAVLLLTGVLALFVGGQFAKPIESLTSVAEQLSAGDLSAKADERSNDEMGALATTFNHMTKQLNDTLLGLEERVAERTHDLELASKVGRSVSEKVGSLNEMLSQAVEQIRSDYGLYYTQIYLTDASARALVLHAGTGEIGMQLLQRGHRLAVPANSLNSRAASTQAPVLVGNTQKSTGFLPNPLLPLTRSELAIPLITSDKVVGVLDMQSERPERFSEANIPAFQVLASQLAIAIQNSYLYDQSQEARLAVEDQAKS